MSSTGWTDRQMPAGDEVFLDHTGFFVSDLEPAADKLTRLGFKVSAVNVQTNDVGGRLEPSGTSNRLVRLRRGYLEVLAATHDTPLAAQFRQGISRYEGLHLIAFCHDDIARTREHLVTNGFAMQPVVHLRRHDKTLPGAPEVAWFVARPEPGVMPEGRVQFAKSLNPERVWPADQVFHANAADALTDLLICVVDAGEAADRYGRYTGRDQQAVDGLHTVALDRGRLVFVSPDAAESAFGIIPPTLPYIAGQAIRSTNIAVTTQALRDGGAMPLHADERMVLLGPRDALGGYLLFHATTVGEPWRALAAKS